MERINGYEDAKAYTDAEKLPAGGYGCKNFGRKRISL